MKKLLLIFLLFSGLAAMAQVFTPTENPNEIGKKVKLNLGPIIKYTPSISSTEPITLVLPMPSGKNETITLTPNQVSEKQPKDVKTFNGVSKESNSKLKLGLTPSGFTAIIHFNNEYYFIERLGNNVDYSLFSIGEVPNGECNANSNMFDVSDVKKSAKMSSISPFPVGTQLRKFRMAAAATGEMVTTIGSKTAARNKIIEMINLTNLIYEVEAAMTFELISETTGSMSILFDNAATDPFTVDPGFANANNAQAGFTSMNSSAILAYSKYDIGHVFNIKPGSGGASGQAGPTPCDNNSKARAWTEFTADAPSAFVVGVFVHEMGHQFRAWHTFNSSGGSPGSPTFCDGGWDDGTAVAPGSGVTLMGYGGNCSFPVNYVLTAPNDQSYFHTKSLEQIFVSLNTYNTCYTTTATGNTPPVSNAGANLNIPKGTPFMLKGSATDVNTGNVLSYTWDQVDIATANDKGALGSSINGVGGYPAVNSTTAPLFRSKLSSNPERIFPNLADILNSDNNPNDNQGEDLSQVGRTITMRMTVRDNAAGGGGVDTDEVLVLVNGSAGPLKITSNNSPGSSISAGSSQTITWAVNSTNSISANVKISLSVDGGNSFPYILIASTPNDGSQSVTIPSGVVNSSVGRIKVSSLHHATGEFFDINNQNINITSTCLASNTFICSDQCLVANQGSPSLNLSLTNSPGIQMLGNSKVLTLNASSTNYTMYAYVDDTHTACHPTFGRKGAFVKFRVTKSGNYTINPLANGSSTVSTVYNSATFNCSSFVGSNAEGSISWSGPYTVLLNECTDYWVVVNDVFGYNNGGNVSFSGLGNIIESLAAPAGFNYTYIAVNKATNLINAVSSTSNFTTLSGGDYDIYGLQFEAAYNPTTALSKTVSQILTEPLCKLISANYKPVKVIGSPCPNDIVLVSTANDIISGTVKMEAAKTITASNDIKGGRVKYDAGKSIFLNPGFSTVLGVVFEAYIDGCGNL